MRIRKTAAVSCWLLRSALASAITLAAGPVKAQVDGSVSIVSDYRFRGASLSDGHPEPQVQLGYDGTGGWYVGGFAYSAESGHSFRRKLDSCSSANWTRIPRRTGHFGRNPAGSKFGFYS
jgi:uncharacterized protein (TIGR02001 family)